MTVYFHLRAVPPPALRNSATWFRRLFEDDWNTVRDRIGRHREEVLDRLYGDVELLYRGVPPDRAPDGPRTQVVLGGRPAFQHDTSQPPFLLLTASQVAGVAAFLRTADFDALWLRARGRLPRPYGAPDAECLMRGLFAATHRDLTAFYGRTAEDGDAVVKWLMT